MPERLDRWTRIALVATLGVLCFFSVWAFLAPAGLLAPVDIRLGSATATGEIRGFYGGLELALALLIGLTLRRPARWNDGLALAAAVGIGIGGGRGIGALLDGAPNAVGFLAMGLELGGGLIAAALLLLRLRAAKEPR